MCNSSFELPKELAAHLRENHPNKNVILQYNLNTSKIQKSNRFECYICKMGLNSFKEVKKHLKQHVAARDKKCVICKECLTSNELNEHVCYSNKSIACDYCEETFNATAKMMQHITSNHEDRIVYKCRKCSQYFGSMRLREFHERKHEDQHRSFACDICSKGLTSKRSLTKHMAVHSTKSMIVLIFLCI